MAGTRDRAVPAERQSVSVQAQQEKAAAALAQNAAFIGHSLRALEQGPVDLLNLPAVEERFMEYVQSCAVTGTVISPPGLASWLGITSSDLKDWLRGYGPEEQRRSAQRIYQVLHQSFVDNALAGKLGPQTVQFFAKNWFGYSDIPEGAAGRTVEQNKTVDQLAKEAEQLTGEVIEASYTEVKSKKKKGGGNGKK